MAAVSVVLHRVLHAVGRRCARQVKLGLPAILVASLLTTAPAPAVAAEPDSPQAAADRSVAVQALEAAQSEEPVMPEDVPGPDPVWPEEQTTLVDLGGALSAQSDTAASAPSSLPVALAPVAGSDMLSGQELFQAERRLAAWGLSPQVVQVHVTGRDVARQLGINGVVFALSRADGVAASAPAKVDFDYSSFANGFGGDFASRLRLFELPACALSTPELAKCQTMTPVAGSVNDVKAGRVSAGRVAVAADTTPGASGGQGGGSALGAGAGPDQAGGSEPAPVTVLAVAATSSSSESGSFAKTDLKSSSQWTAGGNSGDFSYSYPFSVPPVPGSLTPDVSLSYSSGSVDGQTAGENTQPGVFGEGWNYTPGFIERTYRPCFDDTANSPRWTALNGTADLCWRLPNAQISLNGKTSEIILGDDGKWRLADDDGENVKLLTGAGNGDNNGEYWRITTTDGTHYFFGRHTLPNGKGSTNSTATVPVFANHSGEPCYSSSSALASRCLQGWRWMLDYVIDPQGNEISYWYSRTINRTALMGKAGTTSSYYRSVRLLRIEYGTHISDASSRTAPARVYFSHSNRCVTSSCGTKNRANWPDTPWDLHCAASPCANNLSPSFWSSTMVTKIWAQVLDGSGAYTTVDHWDLPYQFPATGTQANPVLWLKQIKHVGRAGAGQTSPPVDFSGQRTQNRADYDPNANMQSHQKWRVYRVKTESGTQVDVTYSADQPGCRFGDTFPNPDQNNARCFPQLYTNNYGQTGWSWWNKRIVNSVVESDLTGGSPATVTNYSYSTASTNTNVLWSHGNGSAVWAASLSKRSWSHWRGYTDVTVTSGPASGTRSRTDYLFLRGMHGDRSDSGTRSVTVTPYDPGGAAWDTEYRAGHLLNKRIWDRNGGTAVQLFKYDPWAATTGTRTLNSSWAIPTVHRSYITRTDVIMRWEWVDGAWSQRSYTEDSFDTAFGRLLTREDRGDTGVADTTCTRYAYANGAARHMLSYVYAETVYPLACADPYTFPDDLLAERKWRFDGGDLGALPSRGNATKHYVLREQGSYVTVHQNTSYDKHGRITSSADGLGHTTTTAYTENADGLTTKITATNALGHTSSTTLDPRRGQPTSATDANGKTTTASYDGSGRLTSVTKPGNTTGLPDAEYMYALNQDNPSWVLTKTLGPNGNQISSYEIYDGMLRLRQSQTVAPDGKRVIADTQYNAFGQPAKTSVFYNADSGPTSTLVGFADADIDRQTRFTYDGRGRQLSAETWSNNALKWKTATVYAWDRTAIIPPAGGTTTQDVFDDLGRVKEKRQYHSTNLGGGYDATGYGYDLLGQLTSVTDPAGNSWTYTYDMIGNKIQSTDPDAGTISFTYDALGNLASSTDARGQALHYEYDQLGRKVRQRQDSVDGTVMAEWVYDTLAKGQLSSATRFDSGHSYTSKVAGYDDAYRPLTSQIVIPAVEGDLAGTYTTDTIYKPNGAIESQSMPGWGGLPAETLTYDYTATGLLASMTGLDDYLADVAYAWDAQIVESRHGAVGKQVRQSFAYEAATGRLDNQQIDNEDQGAPGTWVDQFTTEYGYDAAGNIKTIAGKTAGVRDQVECFGYDHLRRLTQAWTNSSWDCAAAPQPGGAGADPYWHTWSFDSIGNRLSQTDKGATGDTTWTYNTGTGYGVSAHQLASVDATGPLAQAPSRSFAYDTAGNMTSRTTETGNSQTLAWTPDGHLYSVTEGADSTEYVYDADGNRLLQRSPGKTTLYLGSTELEDSASGGPVLGTRYYAGYAVRSANGLKWTCADHHGTGQVQIDAVTLDAVRQRSLPYGEARGPQAAGWEGSKGYVGGTKDDTGLTHLGAREYDPTLGRFISVDPIMDLTDPDQWHGYAYSHNNPATFSDPSGLYDFEGDSNNQARKRYGGKGKNSTMINPSAAPPCNGRCKPPKEEKDPPTEPTAAIIIGGTVIVAPSEDELHQAIQAAADEWCGGSFLSSLFGGGGPATCGDSGPYGMVEPIIRDEVCGNHVAWCIWQDTTNAILVSGVAGVGYQAFGTPGRAPHVAVVSIFDQNGKLVNTTTLRSGGMTAGQRALGFPLNTLATHTEAKAAGLPTPRGGYMVIEGSYAPCTPCRGAMARAAQQGKVTIAYTWAGRVWLATPTLSGAKYERTVRRFFR